MNLSKSLMSALTLLLCVGFVDVNESTAQTLTVENTSLETAYIAYIHRNGNGINVHQGLKTVPAGQSKVISMRYHSIKSPTDVAVRVFRPGHPVFKFAGRKSITGFVDTKSQDFRLDFKNYDGGAAKVYRNNKYLGKFHMSQLSGLGFRQLGDFYLFPFDRSGRAKIRIQ